MQEAMRKSFSILMLFAAAAIASVSCQKQDAATSELEQTTLVFTSEKPDFDDAVKTEWVEAANDVYWSDGDKIRMAYTITVDGTPVWQGAEGANNKDGNPEEARFYISDPLDFDGGTSRIGTFRIPGSFKEDPANPMLEVGSYNFYTLYPSNSNTSGEFVSKRPGVVYITLKPEQTPKANSFDSGADIMVGRSVSEYDGLPTEAISVNWNRAVAHAYITLENLKESVAGEVVNNITLTAQADANIAGTFTIDITDGTIEPRNDSNPKNKLTINGTNLPAITSSQDVSFWACLNPCTLTSLTVEVDTDKATYVRSIDLSANNKTFLKNRRNLLSINMGGGDVVRTPKADPEPGTDKYYVKVTSAPTDWSGTYLIVCEDAGVALTGSGNDANSIKKGTVVTISDSKIAQNNAMDAICVSIESNVTCGYLVKTQTDYYIYHTGSISEDHFKATTNSGTADNYNVSFEISDGLLVFKTGSGYLRYNKSSNIFNYYVDGSKQTPIQLYKLED